MNTRTYPRTLGEAFRNTTHYACAVERPARRRPWAAWLFLGALYGFAVLAWSAR